MITPDRHLPVLSGAGKAEFEKLSHGASIQRVSKRGQSIWVRLRRSAPLPLRVRLCAPGQSGHSSKMADTLNNPVLNQYRARRVIEYEGDVPREEVWNVHKSTNK